jgi:hypothetical protein
MDDLICIIVLVLLAMMSAVTLFCFMRSISLLSETKHVGHVVGGVLFFLVALVFGVVSGVLIWFIMAAEGFYPLFGFLAVVVGVSCVMEFMTHVKKQKDLLLKTEQKMDSPQTPPV